MYKMAARGNRVGVRKPLLGPPKTDRLSTGANPFDGSSLVPLPDGSSGYPWEWILRGIIIGAAHTVGIQRVIDLVISAVSDAGHELRAEEPEEEIFPDPEVEDLRDFRDSRNPFHRRYFVDHRNVDVEHVAPTPAVIEGIKQDVKPDIKYERPRAVFVLGGSGTGKTSAAKFGMKWFSMKPGEFSYINTDDIMGMLPGYQGLRGGLGSVNGVPMVDHDAGDEYIADAKKITAEIFEESIDEGLDIMFDGTGRNQASLARRVHKVRDAGYDVSIVHTSLSSDEAYRRSHDSIPGRDYRTVPEHVYRNTNPGEGVEAIVEHLGDEIMDTVDDLIVYDTSVRRTKVFVVAGELEPDTTPRVRI